MPKKNSRDYACRLTRMVGNGLVLIFHRLEMQNYKWKYAIKSNISFKRQDPKILGKGSTLVKLI